MKPLKTAPQILEHYMPNWFKIKKSSFIDEAILKAMRHYARVKSNKVIENYTKIDMEQCIKDIREEVKDEMYDEARRHILEQYDLN